MDKALEQKIAEDIRKRLRLSLKPFDFKRTKPTFFTKLKNDRIDFVHLHKFTFGPRFRVHIGSRFLCDQFDAIALNGIDSDRFGSKYNFEYGAEEESIQRCVDEMMNFIRHEGFQWFDYWSDPARLLNASSSPIKNMLDRYSHFCNGEMDEEINLSYKLLGIKQ